MENLILNTVLFTDDKVFVASTENERQTAIYALNSIAI
jgi:hypothetical protein